MRDNNMRECMDMQRKKEGRKERKDQICKLEKDSIEVMVNHMICELILDHSLISNIHNN